MYYIVKDAGYFFDFLQELDGNGLEWGEKETAQRYLNFMAAAHQAKILGADVVHEHKHNAMTWVAI